MNNWLFPNSTGEARQIQDEIVNHLILEPLQCMPRLIAGVDVSNNRFDPQKMIFAAVVVLTFPALEIVEIKTSSEKQRFPYIPGLLGFREAPAIVTAFNQLTVKPDLLLVDGHGISHPRSLGVATHLGILLNLPSIGVAKSILVGDVQGTALVWKERQVATVLSTKKRCSPLYISPGHKIDFAGSVEYVLKTLRGYRIPEPTRLAHIFANQTRRDFFSRQKPSSSPLLQSHGVDSLHYSN